MHSAIAVDGVAVTMIETEPRIVRDELREYEWTAIKPMLPNERAPAKSRLEEKCPHRSLAWITHRAARFRHFEKDSAYPGMVAYDAHRNYSDGVHRETSTMHESQLVGRPMAANTRTQESDPRKEPSR